MRSHCGWRLYATSCDRSRAHVITDSLLTTYLLSSEICPLSFIFNMFGVFKSSKRCVVTSLSRTLKRGCSTLQPISLLCAPKMGRLSLLPPLPLSQLRRLLQSTLFSESPLLVRIFDNVYLIYEIYLLPEFPNNCHLRMFHLIVILFIRSD